MKKALSPSEREMLAALAAKMNEEIDVADIPEAPDANGSLARRPDLYRPVKRAVTIRLDADVIEWFKARA